MSSWFFWVSHVDARSRSDQCIYHWHFIACKIIAMWFLMRCKLWVEESSNSQFASCGELRARSRRLGNLITNGERGLHVPPSILAESGHASDLDEVGDWLGACVDDICSHYWEIRILLWFLMLIEFNPRIDDDSLLIRCGWRLKFRRYDWRL